MKSEAKHGIYCKVCGVNPRNKILEFFLEMRELDFSIGDVARETGLNRVTAYNTMSELIKEDLILPTRKVSGGQLYKLNLKSREVQLLIETFNFLLGKIVEKHTKKEKIYA